jgi:hypothetical protein
MRTHLEKRLTALERKIIIEPLPPFVVSCQADDGSVEYCWIGWFDNGVSKSWNCNDGVDLPDALKAQMQQYNLDNEPRAIEAPSEGKLGSG